MLSRTSIGALVLASSVALASCGAPVDDVDNSTASPVATAAHRLIGPDEFASAIAEGDRVTINVHVPYEGEIDGTDLFIPFDQIADHRDRLPRDRGAPLAIYCRSGPMSATAAETLSSWGYTDVVELDGGMKAWQASGRPLIGV